MAIHEESIVVNAPVHRVFRMWSNFENFPSFMSHVREVRMLDGNKSHWKATVAGISEEWDAETTEMERDKAIGWKSISGLQNSGEVRFERVDGGTKITVHIEYEPPVGALGDAAEAIYVGRQFDKDLCQDLERFKTRAEAA